jgi:hypothetical protein
MKGEFIMKKFVIMMILCLVAMIGLMVYGEATCVAETAKDFESLDDCMTKMGYETYELSREVIENYCSVRDQEGFESYIRQTVGLAEDEDMMMLSVNGDGTYPAAGLVYKLSDKRLHMEDRIILRVVIIELV